MSIALFFKGAQSEDTTNADNIFKWIGYFPGFQSFKESGLWLLSDFWSAICLHISQLSFLQVFSGEMAEKWRRASFWNTDLTDFEWSDVLTQIFTYIPLQRFKVLKGSPKYGKPIWNTQSTLIFHLWPFSHVIKLWLSLCLICAFRIAANFPNARRNSKEVNWNLTTTYFY